MNQIQGRSLFDLTKVGYLNRLEYALNHGIEIDMLPSIIDIPENELIHFTN